MLMKSKGVTGDECEGWRAASDKQKAKSEREKTAEPTDNPPRAAHSPVSAIGRSEHRRDEGRRGAKCRGLTISSAAHTPPHRLSAGANIEMREEDRRSATD